MESTFNKAINKYYLLKKKYQEERDKMKRKIMDNNNYSLSDKKEKISLIKQSCIFCNDSVGTLFYKKDGVLYAKCGNSENPCDKSIEIKTSQYLQLNTIIDYLHKDISDITDEIINNKTKLVLGVENSDDVIPVFEEYMELYNDSHEILIRLQQKKEYLAISTKEDELNALNEELKNYITNVKTILNNYKAMTNKDKQLLTETNMLYKDYILPTEEKINEVRFKSRTLNFEPEGEIILHVKNESFKEQDTLHDVDDPEVRKFDDPAPKPKPKPNTRPKTNKSKKQNRPTYNEDMDAGLSKPIECDVTDEAFCPIKFNDDNIDYTLPINQNYDCNDKKLMLKLHPDKNTGCEDCGTEAMKLYNSKCK
jgi:hypothetical protein